MKSLFLLFILLISMYNSLPAQPNSLNDSIPPGKNFEKAFFQLWYPAEVGEISGIIVLMPGSNADGRSLCGDTQWQQLAKKLNFALLGCYLTDYKSDNMMIEKYVNVKEGSGQSLLDAVSHFAIISGHPELANAPFLLWGHSAGGEFNFEFVCWHPEKVIAFVVNKGGFYYNALAPAEARNVPGIFFTGEKDLEERKDIIKGIYFMNRRAGAFWTFAEEPGAGHEIGQTQKLAEFFFIEVVSIRMIDFSKGSKGLLQLKPIAADSSFIGDLDTKTILQFSENQNNDSHKSWLISLAFADAWLSFIKQTPF
jgi:hypothetical protein